MDGRNTQYVFAPTLPMCSDRWEQAGWPVISTVHSFVVPDHETPLIRGSQSWLSWLLARLSSQASIS
jgi:hypothetical protein